MKRRETKRILSLLVAGLFLVSIFSPLMPLIGNARAESGTQDSDNDGLSDEIEREWGSNPDVPNTWEAFDYGFEEHPGEPNDGEHGLHRYARGNGVAGSGYDLTDTSNENVNPIYYYTVDDDKEVDGIRLNRDGDPNTGDNGKEFAVPCSKSSEGWILVGCTYSVNEDDDAPEYATFEAYYNVFDQTVRIYMYYFNDNAYNYGIAHIESANQNPIFQNGQTSISVYLDNLAASNWYYMEFFVFYYDDLGDYIRVRLWGGNEFSGSGVFQGYSFGSAEVKSETQGDVHTTGWSSGVELGVSLSPTGISIGPSVGFSYGESTSEIHTHTTSNWEIRMTTEGDVEMTLTHDVQLVTEQTALKIHVKPKDKFTDEISYNNILGIYNLYYIKNSGKYDGGRYSGESPIHCTYELESGDEDSDLYGVLKSPAIPTGIPDPASRSAKDEIRVKVVYNPFYNKIGEHGETSVGSRLYLIGEGSIKHQQWFSLSEVDVSDNERIFAGSPSEVLELWTDAEAHPDLTIYVQTKVSFRFNLNHLDNDGEKENVEMNLEYASVYR